MPSPTDVRLKGVRYPLDHNPRALRLRRYELGLTQDTIAKRAGISPGHLSELECGKRNALAPTLLRVAAALECPVSELMAS